LTWPSIHSTLATRIAHQDKSRQFEDIKKEEGMPDCPATMPHGPGTTLLSRVCFPAALNTTTTPASAATIHRGPPHSQLRIQQYIIAHGRPDASSLHSRPDLRPLPAPVGKAQ